MAELTHNDAYNDNGPVNHKRIARIMKKLRLRGYSKKRKVTTTRREPNRVVFADLVKRDFTAPAANRVLVSDITYLPIADGPNMYLALVIDCYTRMLVGFAIADHMRTELVGEALEHAQPPRESYRGDLSFRPRKCLCLIAVSGHLPQAQRHPVEGRSGHQCR